MEPRRPDQKKENVSVGVPKEVIQAEDYALDADILRLSSLNLFKSLIDLNSVDVGNCFVTILSLVFLRMTYFPVNSRKTSWKDRSVFT